MRHLRKAHVPKWSTSILWGNLEIHTSRFITVENSTYPFWNSYLIDSLHRISENKFSHSQPCPVFFPRREIALTRLIGDVHSCRRDEVTSMRGKSACVYALHAARDSSFSHDDVGGASSFRKLGRKQSGRILMDYTCRHRLLRDHGPHISSIIVYARCVNIMFYIVESRREDRRGAAVLTRWAPLSILFDGTRSEKSTCSNVSRQHAVMDHLQASRNSGKLRSRAHPWILSPTLVLSLFFLIFFFFRE